MPIAIAAAPGRSAGARRRPPDHARPDRGQRDRPQRQRQSSGRASAATAGRASCSASAAATATCPCARRPGLFDPDVGTNAAGQPGDRLHALRRALGPQLRRVAVRRLRPPRAQGAGRLDATAARSSRRRSGSARSRSRAAGPGRCNGLYVVRRGKRARGSTTACRPRPTCAATASPTCTSRRATRPARPCASAARDGGKSRVVVTGFAAEGESYRVSSPVLDRPLRLLAPAGPVRNEFFAGRARAPQALGARVHQPPVPGRGRLDRGRARRGSSTPTARASTRRPTRRRSSRPRRLESPASTTRGGVTWQTHRRQDSTRLRVRGGAGEDPRVRERGR